MLMPAGISSVVAVALDVGIQFFTIGEIDYEKLGFNV